MAGVFAIFDKGLSNNGANKENIENAMNSLKAEESQKHIFIQCGAVSMGAVAKIGQEVEDVFYHDKKNGIYVALDGFCRISSEYLKNVEEKLNPASQRDHLAGITELISRDVESWYNKLEGSFNIIVYNSKQSKLWIVNDIFGFYPLCYHHANKYSIFSSKLSAILASKMIARPEFDYTSYAEHLLFNYIISDNSFIKDILCLPAAHKVVISKDLFKSNQYHSYIGLLDSSALGKKDSFELFNSSFEKACDRMMSNVGSEVNMSLTGGWDSRLVLSYLIEKHKDRLKLYSFGAKHAPDITVPQEISASELLHYKAYVLDDDYLANHYKKAARDTVILSEGSRNYKRTHYLYAIQQIAENSIDLITGIFGDEVIKVGKPQGGAVISKNIVKLLGNGFIVDSELDAEFSHIAKLISDMFNASESEIKDKLCKRVQKIGKKYLNLGNSSFQHLFFRFDINLRKYFGAEAASYNDYVNCYSPFIDKHFFFDYLKTSYSSHRHPFTSTNILAKLNSTRLYARLVNKQYPPLLDYPSSRGYNMRQVLNYLDYMKILLIRRGSKKQTRDDFNTDDTYTRFMDLFIEKDYFHDFNKVENKYRDNFISLIYWTENISKEGTLEGIERL